MDIHRWDVSPTEAVAIQKALRDEVRVEPLGRPVRTVAGADASIERFGDELFVGVVVLSYPELKPLCHATARLKASFPYIPGLLSFREIPGLLACLDILPMKPDIIVVDGQGIAHPRRLGIAAHLGVVSGIPTVGCAKSRLYGAYEEPLEPGEAAPISDPRTGERIGFALRSKARSNPLVISPGFRTSVGESLDVVRSCLRGYRLPEPTRLAHALVNAVRRGEIETGPKIY